MDRETIIKLAREAGFQTGKHDYADGEGAMPFVTPIATGTCLTELEHFAKRVAEHEREACAKVVEAAQPFGRIVETAAAIRARGQ